jgi:hypothetical protein
MRAVDAQRIETMAGFCAVASLAAAVGFAVFHLVGLAAGSLSALAAYRAGATLIRMLEGAPKPFPQPTFEIANIEPVIVGDETDERPLTEVLDELVLTEDDRLGAGPLVLDDVLREIAPDSRVVQLFDRSAMPGPAQLKVRIDRHRDGGTSHFPSPDASQALFEALADLRRSLR